MHVRLRPVTDADADDAFAMMRDPEAVRMAAFTVADPDDRAAFDTRWSRHLADPAIRMRAVEADGGFAGTVAAFTLDGDREVTYWIRRPLWGRGIATAALMLLVAAEPTRPLHARVAEANLGSLRVLERAGFTRTGSETSFAAGAGRPVVELLLELR
ncbi:GNAT family N-acetyltransferase [Leifsonia sp. TF02-11]|uniref:GNAT family N-acetyltransferase n=1 Tax=Leifsonia sp. TF02-11 TaxID=2815212 RepID=UPI001AA1AECC|nr:GNAT family N-acetyltransferase [Leifsonia sp. TF02-11]MBN9630871.1 GNAT family N-acetyltransferase [Actinomycetota bacterium]MBO1737295.1 GNAT family N-acetyltransferase [Leifsonia sp. TF02-11]